MADSPLLFGSSNLPKDHQAARKDAIEKMEAIVSELMKVKDQDAADVVRRTAKALKRPLLVVLPDKDGKFLHDGGVKTPPGSDKGVILSTGALRRRGVHGHAWPPVRWQADRRWTGVPVREPQTGSAPGGGPRVETEPAHPRRPALGWLCRPGADGASATALQSPPHLLTTLPARGRRGHQHGQRQGAESERHDASHRVPPDLWVPRSRRREVWGRAWGDLAGHRRGCLSRWMVDLSCSFRGRSPSPSRGTCRDRRRPRRPAGGFPPPDAASPATAPPESLGSYRAFGGGLQGCPRGAAALEDERAGLDAVQRRVRIVVADGDQRIEAVAHRPRRPATPCRRRPGPSAATSPAGGRAARDGVVEPAADP